MLTRHTVLGIAAGEVAVGSVAQNIHQAAKIGADDLARAAGDQSGDLVLDHRRRYIRMAHAERATETAAFIFPCLGRNAYVFKLIKQRPAGDVAAHLPASVAGGVEGDGAGLA